MRIIKFSIEDYSPEIQELTKSTAKKMREIKIEYQRKCTLHDNKSLRKETKRNLKKIRKEYHSQLIKTDLKDGLSMIVSSTIHVMFNKTKMLLKRLMTEIKYSYKDWFAYLWLFIIHYLAITYLLKIITGGK